MTVWRSLHTEGLYVCRIQHLEPADMARRLEGWNSVVESTLTPYYPWHFVRRRGSFNPRLSQIYKKKKKKKKKTPVYGIMIIHMKLSKENTYIAFPQTCGLVWWHCRRTQLSRNVWQVTCRLLATWTAGPLRECSSTNTTSDALQSWRRLTLFQSSCQAVPDSAIRTTWKCPELATSVTGS
jgi:hypothetical protein